MQCPHTGTHKHGDQWQNHARPNFSCLSQFSKKGILVSSLNNSCQKSSAPDHLGGRLTRKGLAESPDETIRLRLHTFSKSNSPFPTKGHPLMTPVPLEAAQSEKCWLSRLRIRGHLLPSPRDLVYVISPPQHLVSLLHNEIAQVWLLRSQDLQRLVTRR